MNLDVVHYSGSKPTEQNFELPFTSYIPQLELTDYHVRMAQNYEWSDLTRISCDQLNGLIWYWNRSDPSHVSNLLTKDGEERELYKVALNFLTHTDLLPHLWPEGFSKVMAMTEIIKEYPQEHKLPPLIFVDGSRYPDAPDSSFIDGVHRSLAYALTELLNKSNDIYIPAYIGRKPSIYARFRRKISV